jgi:hypothetical protein
VIGSLLSDRQPSLNALLAVAPRVPLAASAV